MKQAIIKPFDHPTYKVVLKHGIHQFLFCTIEEAVNYAKVRYPLGTKIVIR